MCYFEEEKFDSTSRVRSPEFGKSSVIISIHSDCRNDNNNRTGGVASVNSRAAGFFRTRRCRLFG